MVGLVWIFAGVCDALPKVLVLESVSSLSEPRIRFEAPESRPELVSVVIEVMEPPDPSNRSMSPLESVDSKTWRRVVRIVAVDPNFTGDVENLPGLLGRFSWMGNSAVPTLRFEPRFPPSPGLEIRVELDIEAWRSLTHPTQHIFDGLSSGEKNAQFKASFRLPEPARSPSTRVVAVYPSGPGGEARSESETGSTATVPANLLRLYVHFSAPMSAQGVVPYIRLLAEDGEPVPVAFVGIPGGLWDPERRRLTLLVHPGRVKRGVGPNEKLGPVLEPGRRYRLQISSEALDSGGLPLIESFEHELVVGPADYQSPNPEHWRIEPPSSPDDKVRVILLEPADRALLGRLPTLLDPRDEPVAGVLDVSQDGSEFTFKPDRPWIAGSYTLWVPPELEDPSGNRPGKLFEASIKRSADGSPEAPEPSRVRFEVDFATPSHDSSGSVQNL